MEVRPRADDTVAMILGERFIEDADNQNGCDHEHLQLRLFAEGLEERDGDQRDPGPDNAALAAIDRGAADDGRRQGDHQGADALFAHRDAGGTGIDAVQRAAEGADRRGDDEGHRCDEAALYAGEPGCFEIAADHAEVAAEGCIPQHHHEQERDDGRDKEEQRDRQRTDRAVQRLIERIVPAGAQLGSARVNVHGALDNELHAECGNEGVNLEFRHEDSVDESDECAGEGRDQNADGPGQPAACAQSQTQKRRKGRDIHDREIHVARDEAEREPEPQINDEASVSGHRTDVVGRKKVFFKEAAEKNQQQKEIASVRIDEIEIEARLFSFFHAFPSFLFEYVFSQTMNRNTMP